jgi:hypothetical protein
MATPPPQGPVPPQTGVPAPGSATNSAAGSPPG